MTMTTSRTLHSPFRQLIALVASGCNGAELEAAECKILCYEAATCAAWTYEDPVAGDELMDCSIQCYE